MVGEMPRLRSLLGLPSVLTSLPPSQLPKAGWAGLFLGYKEEVNKQGDPSVCFPLPLPLSHSCF